ncbi:MAG: nickel pincer cofactor biosynthesis protein LarC [Lachnospiraceae bacterium]|nr:nickel pincer cofactor biosynthesis protein LarC [Lachnospiraceae bacterium]
MGRKLYLECESGISGDMTVAALLDLGGDEKKLRAALASLPLEGYEIKISRKTKAGLDCCDFFVLLDHEHDNHDHDMDYLYGHEHKEDDTDHDHEHQHDHDHHHDHAHDHDHEHHHDHDHHHDHRGIKEIFSIIDAGDLTPGANALAKKTFMIVAKAESKAHGVPVEEVHFHEVGAVDSIVDVVSAAVLFDDLGMKDAVVTGLCEGHGTVRCQHGIIPVPVPAVVHIAEAEGLTLIPVNVKGELVTPTGAAIAAAVRTEDKLPSAFRILKTGLGAGKRAYNRPGFVRAFIIEADDDESEAAGKDTIVKLESNLDDCPGEFLGYLMEKLMEAGARDVHFTPVFMKKNRPGYQINVICDEENRDMLENIIFAETTTIGIRRITMERTVMERRMESVDTPYGPVRMKISSINGTEKSYPEYEDVKAIAKKEQLPVQELYRMLAK